MSLSSSHTIASQTSGPSTSYACPAVSRQDASHVTTYAVIQESQDTKTENEGRTIWSWNTHKGDEGSLVEKAVSVLSTRIISIHVVPSLRALIAVFISGAVVALEGEPLEIPGETHQYDCSSTNPVVLKSFVFPRGAFRFAPPDAAAAIVTAWYAPVGAHDLVLSVVLFDDEGIVMAQWSKDVTVEGVDGREIRDLSFDRSGNFTVLDDRLHWTWFELARSGDQPLSATTSLPPIRLKQEKFTSLTKLDRQGQPRFTSDVALLHLNTTHVLLAGISPSHDLQLLIWDVQYQVLIASHIMPLPSTVHTSSPKSLQLVHELVMMGITHLPDLPEDVLVKVLQRVIVALETDLESSSGQNQRDLFLSVPNKYQRTVPPPFMVYLNEFLRYPLSVQPLRIALKKYLNIDQVTLLLTGLELFISQHPELPFSYENLGQKTVLITEVSRAITFIQTLLDTFFPAILSHSPAHEPLRRIQAYMTQKVEDEACLEPLRGPLEFYAKMHTKALSKQEEKQRTYHTALLKVKGKHEWQYGTKRRNISVYEIERLKFQVG
ncbi:hypothetical protein FRB99_006289 [Tulasnella sp. 403]|nr:hypothetical protein FRB99_006289 [Tulasnella sp. 403]